MKVLTGKSYKRASLFSLSLALVVSGLSVAVPLYLSQIVHAGPAPAPAPILTLTVPAARTITRSALVPETSGTPTGGNTVVDAAIIGLAPIAVTLANTGDAASANVRISPINAGSHIQLWAQDTSNKWFDINVTGWIDSAGMSIPVGFNRTTDIYAISDTTGDYPLTVKLVNAVGGTLITSTTGTVTVAPIIHTQADFTAFDGVGNTNLSTNHANGYTSSSGITATYDNGTGTLSDPVKLTLTGYAPIVTPWFGLTWTTYNYVTVGIKLPTYFAGTSITGGTTVFSTGVIRYDSPENGVSYRMSSIGAGSTPLATAGDASGYLDYSFAANSPNTKKEGLVKLQVIWNANSAPEYFTIDINNLSLTDKTAPTIPVLTSPINGVFIKNNAPLMQWDDSTDIGGSGVASYDYQVYYNCTNPGNIPGSCSSVTNVNSLSSSEYQAGSTGDGVYYWQVRAKDNAGNQSNWSELEKVTIDSKKPAMTITSPTANQIIKGRSVAISGTATDSDFNYYYCYISNVNGHEYGSRDASCNTTWHAVNPNGLLGTITLPNDLADGNYVVHLIGYDKAMNSAETTQSFVLDNNLPTGSVNYTGGNKVSDIIYLKSIDELKFDAAFTDNQALEHTSYAVWKADSDFQNRVLFCGNWNHAITSVGISSTSASVSGNVKDCSPTGDWSNGSYVIMHIVYDAAGNATYLNNYPGQKFVIDNTPPVIIINSYNTNSTNQDINVTASTNEGTLNATSHTFFANGPFTFTATDFAGNSSSQTVTITNIDKTSPVVAISAPGDGDVVNDTVTISGSVTDNNPDHYYLVVNDSLGTVIAGPGTVYQANVSDWSWDTTKLTDGTYTIDLEARDAAGNKDANSTKTINVTVDNTAPVIVFAGITQNGNKFSSNITTNDVNAVPAWTADPSNPSGATFDNTLVSPIFTLSSFGPYKYTLTVTDAIGNPSKPQDVTFSYTAPKSVQLFQSAAITPLTTTPQTTGTTTNTGGGTVADTTGQVLGDQTSKANTNDKGTVKGDSTTKNNDNTWSFLGLAWYWWLLILAAVASAWWAFSAIRNRRDI